MIDKFKSYLLVAASYVGVFALFVAMIAAVILPLMAILYPFELYYCSVKASGFADYSYHFFAGCFVEIDGVMIPLENVRIEK